MTFSVSADKVKCHLKITEKKKKQHRTNSLTSLQRCRFIIHPPRVERLNARSIKSNVFVKPAGRGLTRTRKWEEAHMNLPIFCAPRGYLVAIRCSLFLLGSPSCSLNPATCAVIQLWTSYTQYMIVFGREGYTLKGFCV